MILEEIHDRRDIFWLDIKGRLTSNHHPAGDQAWQHRSDGCQRPLRLREGKRHDPSGRRHDSPAREGGARLSWRATHTLGLFQQTDRAAQGEAFVSDSTNVFVVWIPFTPFFTYSLYIKISGHSVRAIRIEHARFAHGFASLDPINTVLYSCTQYRNKNSEHGILWNDKTLKINWKVKKPIISKKDRKNPEFEDRI